MKINSINPATGEEIEEYTLHTWEEIQGILQQSSTAYRSWKSTSMESRKQLFLALAKTLRSHKNKYAQLMSTEMGKPISQAIAEVEKCAWTCEVYTNNVDDWIADEISEADGLKHRVVYQPLGVILSVMPWNFPFWQVFRFAIPSLIMGNTTILKHSNDVPGCALAIEEIFNDAGFPDHVFQTILADHHNTEQLLASDIIQGVSLTGSTEAGRHIAKLAGQHLKKVVLELGGSDPFIVFDDVNLDFVIKQAVIGRTQNNGQSCIAAKRFFVHEAIIEEFTKRFGIALHDLKIGNPLDPQTEIGPMANIKEWQMVAEQVDDAREKGGVIVTGGEVIDEIDGKQGYYYQPTLITNVHDDMRIVSEEVFGPAAPVIPFISTDEVIQMANESQFGLGGSVWTKDLEKGEYVARALEVGSVFVNSIVKSDPRMPFGGVKQSGLGRELSKFGLKEFVNIKGLNVYKHQ